jgi:NhaP-type Na+/H+ or K+/H+ antiporter
MEELAAKLTAWGAGTAILSASFMLLILLFKAANRNYRSELLWDMSRTVLFIGPAMMFTAAFAVSPTAAPHVLLVALCQGVCATYVIWNYRQWRKEQDGGT